MPILSPSTYLLFLPSSTLPLFPKLLFPLLSTLLLLFRPLHISFSLLPSLLFSFPPFLFDYLTLSFSFKDSTITFDLFLTDSIILSIKNVSTKKVLSSSFDCAKNILCLLFISSKLFTIIIIIG